MPAQIAIMHGWSDTSNSFHNLRGFLSRNGYETAQIFLADYISMDDDVRIEDVAKRMERVLRSEIAQNRLREPFDLIVHSTGGLVAREWVARFYPRGEGCPAKRVIMLAPANFGSALASKGKSMIGRVLKGWDNWFHTGVEMLNGLELASPYQWQLARRDLLDPDGGGDGPYGGEKIWPFVIAGTRGYADGLKRVVNENGSDGTVRAAAANLNAVGLTIDFSKNHAKPDLMPWKWRNGDDRIPFAILPDRDHGTIIDPASNSGTDPSVSDRVGRLILEALACDSPGKYKSIEQSWAEINEQTTKLGDRADNPKAMFRKDVPAAAAFHQFLQVIALVRDDHGQPVNDYFLEFFAPGGDDSVDEDAEIHFQRTTLRHVHVNKRMPNMRSLFVDRTDLMSGYYPLIPPGRPKELAVSMSAANIGENIRYFDETKVGAKGQLIVHAEREDAREGLPARLIRNTTHLLEIIIPRQPIPKVFKFAKQ